WSVRLQNLNRSAHCAERVSYFMRKPRADASDRSQTVFSPSTFLDRSYFGEILKSDNKPGRLIRFRKKFRNSVTDPHSKAFRSLQVGLKTRMLLAIADGVEREIDLILNIAKKRKDRSTDDRLWVASRYLEGSGVDRIDISIEIGGYQTGFDRFDNAFVQGTQVGE